MKSNQVAFPSFLYGKFADVKKETSKIVTKLKKGIPIGEIVSDYDWITPSESRGKILLDGPNPNNGSGDYFHLFTLPRLLLLEKVTYDPKYAIHMKRFFTDMMSNPWSHAVLSCGQSVYSYYSSENNRILYLKKLIEYREQYLSINSFVEGLPFMSWYPDGSVRFNITEIFNAPGFIGKFVVGNLDHVKIFFAEEEIRTAMVGEDIFVCIKKFGVENCIG